MLASRAVCNFFVYVVSIVQVVSNQSERSPDLWDSRMNETSVGLLIIDEVVNWSFERILCSLYVLDQSG